jgi:protein-S-isoprenylcysteine O-methyltransferase Ste14
VNRFRYVVAVLVVISLPPGLLYWFIIHPFASFWRKLGPGITFTVNGILMLACLFGLWVIRNFLVGPDYGTNYWLIGAGVVLMAVAIVMAVKRRRLLTFSILAGVPEVTPDAGPGKLLTEGPYSVCRNPRYIEVLIGTFAYALVANYLGGYLITLAAIPSIYILVLIEEAELRNRFGQPYVEYCRRVPRFFPNLKGS